MRPFYPSISDVAKQWILLGLKAGDRARLCPHLEAVIYQHRTMPDVWKEKTPRGSWAIVCGDCKAAARQQHLTLDEQISIIRAELSV